MPPRSLLPAVAVLLAGAACLAQTPAGYQVVVHPDNPEGAVSGPALSDMFLKKTVQWPNGLPIDPVNLAGEAAVGEAFAHDIHHRSVANVKNFWNQAVFSGRAVQPLELATSADVVRYVAGHPGAIGYVAAGTALDGVKPLSVVVPPRVAQRVEPEYPPMARSSRAAGDVVLSVEVDASGNVGRVNVVKELPLGMTRAAVQAVQRWRFEPAMLNGKPMAREIEISVHFGPQPG